jgi:hypothetical protein
MANNDFAVYPLKLPRSDYEAFRKAAQERDLTCAQLLRVLIRRTVRRHRLIARRGGNGQARDALAG